MFNTDFIQLLQSFDHPIMHAFMQFFSFLASIPVVFLFTLIIAFGLELKRGILLINIIVWSAFFSNVIKEEVNYPRPYEVDAAVEHKSEKELDQSFQDQLPENFFGLLPKEVIQLSADEETSPSFPSSTAAIQTSLWLSFLLLFRKRWILYLGLLMIILSSLSRMYLGAHFPADIIGGIILGVVISLLLLRYVKLSGFLKLQTHDYRSLSFFWLPWLVAPFAAVTTYWQIAGVLGLNMAVLLVVQRRNFPIFHVIPWKRITAAALVVILYILAFFLSQEITFKPGAFLSFLMIFAINFLIVLGALSLSRRLFLMKYRMLR